MGHTRLVWNNFPDSLSLVLEAGFVGLEGRTSDIGGKRPLTYDPELYALLHDVTTVVL